MPIPQTPDSCYKCFVYHLRYSVHTSFHIQSSFPYFLFSPSSLPSLPSSQIEAFNIHFYPFTYYILRVFKNQYIEEASFKKKIIQMIYLIILHNPILLILFLLKLFLRIFNTFSWLNKRPNTFLVINLVPTSILSHLLKVSIQIAFLYSLPIFFM